jgi:NADH-quinone oxidoreductase subunit G
MCSRCIRFSDEIARQPVLTFTERGTHVVLRTFPGTQLDNPYSMNVIELCPVGALTSRDFRFKSRVWEMSSTESVCVGCARGCNTNIWVRNNEILRITPRQNEAVNSYWMCDYGRLDTFKHIAGEKRLNGPLVRRNGVLVEVGWDEAIARVVSELRTYRKHEIAALGSAYATNEDNYVFAKLMKDVVGVKNIGFVPHINENAKDDFLIHQDKTPNSVGVAAIGLTTSDAKALFKSIENGTIKALYILEDNILVDSKLKSILANLELLIVHSSVRNETTHRADIVLSCSTYAEKHGTITNFEGRVQQIRPAVATMDQDRALNNFEMSRWDKFAAQNDTWGKGSRKDARSTVRIIASIASTMGIKWKYTSMEEAFKDLAEHIPAYKGLTYSKIGSSGILIKELTTITSQKVGTTV